VSGPRVLVRGCPCSSLIGSVMSDLIITKAVLEDSAAKLQHISDELEHQKSDDRALSEVYGQRDVQKAMHDFSGDWKIHRNKMKGAVKDLGEKMRKASENWSALEQDLAEKLSTEHHDAAEGGAA
jgi:NifU-like protein involved in Fe-S cluster formation